MIQFKQLDRSSIWFLIVLITAMVFPWHERISSIGIALLILHWIWDRDLWFKIKHFQFTPIIIISWSFFFIHLIALLWSDFPFNGWQSIEVKLSFLILPILFSTENYLNPSRRHYLEMGFVISCAVSFLFCIVYTFWKYPTAPLSTIFHRMTISESIMHPGYYSNYFAFGIVLIGIHLIKEKKMNTLKRWLTILAFLFFLFAILVLLSKTTILFLLIFTGYLILTLSNLIKNYILRFGLLIFSVIIVVAMFLTLPSLKNRLDDTLINLKIIPTKNVEFQNSTGSRRAAWSLEWELIKQHPILGYGTGSANPLLLNQFKKEGYLDLAKNNMHTHNQVFHTWLDTGIIGVVLLFLFIGYSFYFLYFKKKEYKGAWMGILIFVNILTDDMLEIQAGIVFFIFFLTLYLFKDVHAKRELRYKY